MKSIFYLFLIVTFFSCTGNEKTETIESCDCGDLQLDILYNHFYLTDRTEPFTGMCNKVDNKGNIVEQINYLDGKVHGTLTRFFENGNIESERNYHNNQQQGDMKQWDIEGNLLIHCTYDRGELDSILIDNRR